MTIDVGTGDGRAVLATAAAEPTTLAIGIDADAASMAESSRRAGGRPGRAGHPGRGGHANSLFLVAAAEMMPRELESLADLVTVRLPWGSLLRGCLGAGDTRGAEDTRGADGADGKVAAGLSALLAPTGSLELLLAPAPRDHLAGLPTAPGAILDAVATAFASHGLRVTEGRVATAEELRASRSTWARRLMANGGARTAILVRLRS